tara:strand:+ start:47 stop:478 length:432 start_codon:yes stop_codon:yes gene_type:complete
MKNKILIASDHAGFGLKREIIDSFPSEYFEDLGTNSEESVDYTDYANLLAKRVSLNNDLNGILICATGVGMSIASNKFKNIRAGLAYNSNVAKLIKEHNNANILVLPGKFMDLNEAKKCINNFCNSLFQSGRHSRRIEKIIEK